MIEFVGTLAIYLTANWSWLWIANSFRRMPTVHTFLFETRPLFLVAMVPKVLIGNTYSFFLDHGTAMHVWGLIVTMADVWWAYMVWKMPDDRWKKRRKKAAAKVKQVAERLVVVPEPVPVRN